MDAFIHSFAPVSRNGFRYAGTLLANRESAAMHCPCLYLSDQETLSILTPAHFRYHGKPAILVIQLKKVSEHTQFLESVY